MLIALLLLQVGSFSAIGTNVGEDKPDCGPRWVVAHDVEGFRSDVQEFATFAVLCYDISLDRPVPCPHYIRVTNRFESKKEALEFVRGLPQSASPEVYQIGECVTFKWETEEVKVTKTTGKWTVK